MVPAKFEMVEVVGLQHLIRDGFFCQVCEGAGSGQFHLVIDRTGADVQRAAEDKGEAEDAVDLVWVFGSPCADDGVRTGSAGKVRFDLRVGVRHGEDAQ